MLDHRNNTNEVCRWFSDLWVPELLLLPKIIRMLGPKPAIFALKYAFLCTYRPSQLIWCPSGWLVGGCGARAVSSKTPIYLIIKSNHKEMLKMMFGISKVDSSFKAWSPVALVSEMQFVTLEFLGSVVEPLQSRRVHGYFQFAPLLAHNHP